MATHVTRAGDEEAPAEAPTRELLAGAVGDRCTNCQAPLASDQRYCVNCGERRGKPRFSYATMAAQAAAAPAEVPARPQHRSRASSGAALVAGVGTLLLAMGVGVLIGHDNNSSTRASSPGVQVVTVGGGSGSAAATPTTGASGTAGGRTAAASPKAAAAAAKANVPTVHLTPKTTQAASQAAKKVLGGSAPKNPTQKVGGKCTSGTAGCQNGTFTGNFFGQ